MWLLPHEQCCLRSSDILSPFAVACTKLLFVYNFGAGNAAAQPVLGSKDAGAVWGKEGVS